MMEIFYYVLVSLYFYLNASSFVLVCFVYSWEHIRREELPLIL